MNRTETAQIRDNPQVGDTFKTNRRTAEVVEVTPEKILYSLRKASGSLSKPVYCMWREESR